MALTLNLRQASRSLVRDRLILSLAVVCIAGGVALCTTVFSLTNAFLIRRLPFDRNGELKALSFSDGSASRARLPSQAEFQAWRRASSTDGEFAAFDVALFSVNASSEVAQPADLIRGARVSTNLLRLIGTQPARGRAFLDEDARQGAKPVALLSDDLWRSRFAADPHVVGSTVLVDRVPRVVIGIMPAGFRFPLAERLWIPLQDLRVVDAATASGLHVWALRSSLLSQGGWLLSLERVARAAEQEQRPIENRRGAQSKERLRVLTLREDLLGEGNGAAFVALGVTVMLLLVTTCGTVANLLLIRGAARAKEIAIREALGASRGRIVGQFLTESLMVALAGGAGGVLLSYLATSVLSTAVSSDQLPYFAAISIDGTVLGVAAALTTATGLLCGVAPALQTRRVQLIASLRDGGGGAVGSRTNRFRELIISAEIALALMLLVGATLMIRTLRNLAHANLGFDPRPISLFYAHLDGSRYGDIGTRMRWVDEATAALVRVPGVETVGVSELLPLEGTTAKGTIEIAGAGSAANDVTVDYTGITDGFISALRLSLLEGRAMSSAESRSLSHVAVVNQTFALRVWHGEPATGRSFRIRLSSRMEQFVVVGVVRDFAVNDPQVPHRPLAMLPLPFHLPAVLRILVRSERPATVLLPAVRRSAGSVDQSVAIAEQHTMEQLKELRLTSLNVIASLLTVFGGFAITLAACGVYGVVSYSARQRSREFGVRAALGAGPWQLGWLVLRKGASLAIKGIATGIVLAPLLTQVLRAMLYGVGSLDAMTFVGVAMMLAGLALLASWLPARRATRVDPINAIRGVLS